MDISWSDEKDEVLKATRNVSFWQVKAEIEAGRFAGPKVNPARPGQYIIMVRLNDYPHIVPMVMDESGG